MVDLTMLNALTRLITRMILSLPDSWLIKMSGRPQMTASGGRVFDPAGQFVAVTAIKQGIFALDDTKTIPELREIWRKQMKPFEKPALRGVSRQDRTVEVDGGSITVAEFTHKDFQPGGPAVVFLHGGGYSALGIWACRNLCEYFARELNAKVYAVGYRLAPEHPYPTQINDADAALEWVRANATEFEIDPERISVAGDSAGGNLTAVLCLKRRDDEKWLPKAQMLVYPIIDYTLSHPSIEELGQGHILTTTQLEWLRSNYLQGRPLEKDPYVTPLFASDLSGLPPAVVITAGFDLLRDEGKAYADKLSGAGVEIHYKEFMTEGHGFMYADTTKSIKAANAEISAMFKQLI